MKIAFIWQGFDGRYGHWEDGLYAAMKLLEYDHEVRYYDVTRLHEIADFNPDVALYWEAPCTLLGKDAHNYRNVQSLPYKKALLFAGGPLKKEWLDGFDLVFVESKVNEDDCKQQGINYRRAFGVNTSKMYPIETIQPSIRAFMHATFAGWKRHELFAQAMGVEGTVAGRKQETDMAGYNECVARGVKICPELTADELRNLINRSWCVLNTSNAQGGGQRCTLEAMACGTPVVVMKDSPKNVEFVEESGAGVITEPNVDAIRAAVAQVEDNFNIYTARAHDYVHSKWTEHHYASAIIKGIHSL